MATCWNRSQELSRVVLAYISDSWERWFFKSMTQTTRKDNLSSPNKSRTYDLLVTSADALPLTYRGFVEAIKATKLGSCEETSCILLGLERPYVTYAVAMIETRCSTSEQKETRGQWYGTYQTKFQSGSSLICCFNVGVYNVTFDDNLQYRLKGTNNFDSVIKRPGKNGKRGCHRGGLLAHYYLSKIHRFQKGPAIFVNHNLIQKFLTQSELGVQLWISPAWGLVTLTSLHWRRWARRIDRTPTTPSCCDLYTPLASWLVFRGRRTRRKRSRWRRQSSAFRGLFVGFGAGLSRTRWRRRRWRHFSFFGPASVFLSLPATWTRSATRLFLLDNFNTSLKSLLGS